jgi:hypothetical protein
VIEQNREQNRGHRDGHDQDKPRPVMVMVAKVDAHQ